MSDTPEPVWITIEALHLINRDQVERFVGVHSVREPGTIEAALARPRHRWAYQRYDTIPKLAAAYLYGLASTQGYVDGNKRTALAAALTFLELNGYQLNENVRWEHLARITLIVAESKDADVEMWAMQWFDDNTRRV